MKGLALRSTGGHTCSKNFWGIIKKFHQFNLVQLVLACQGFNSFVQTKGPYSAPRGDENEI